MRLVLGYSISRKRLVVGSRRRVWVWGRRDRVDRRRDIDFRTRVHESLEALHSRRAAALHDHSFRRVGLRDGAAEVVIAPDSLEVVAVGLRRDTFRRQLSTVARWVRASCVDGGFSPAVRELRLLETRIV